jgi:hypothetical protein
MRAGLVGGALKQEAFADKRSRGFQLLVYSTRMQQQHVRQVRKRGRTLYPLPRSTQAPEAGAGAVMDVLAFDPSSATGRSEQKRLTLALSVPGDDEECGIGMDRIAEYRLEWFPPSAAHCVVERKPELTKATITGCGHGFNAVALLYHFLRNEMTCPYCRAGFKGARMYWHVLPLHLRVPMRERMEATLAQERRVQVVEDAAAAWGAQAVGGRTWIGRQVLLMYAFQSEEALAPIVAKEIVLDTSRVRPGGHMRMRPYVNSMRELTRTVRTAGLSSGSGSFELVVATRDLHGCVVRLVRSRRFGTGTAAPECVDAELASMRLEWSDVGDLVGFELTFPESILPALLEQSGAFDELF